jgi:hypothetical protein
MLTRKAIDFGQSVVVWLDARVGFHTGGLEAQRGSRRGAVLVG